MTDQCRACLAVTDTLTSLLTESLPIGLTVLDCFNKCSGIDEVEYLGVDFMPKFICSPCLQDLQISHAFRERCLQSDLQLRQRLQMSTESDDDDVKDKVDGDLIIEILKNESTTGDNNILMYSIIAENQNVRSANVLPPIGLSEISSLKSVKVQHSEVKNLDDDPYTDVETNADDRFTLGTEDLIEENIACDQELASEEISDHHDNKEEIIHEEAKTTATNSNWFECIHCKKGFKLQISLRKHIELQHSGRRLHLCNFCGKMCGSEVSLRTHLLQHRKGDSPYQCLQCEKSYCSKNGLASHMLTHSKQKPDSRFLCSECGKGFTTKQRLRMHTYTHSGERNFGCDLCEKSFATEFRLRSHRRTHTGERPYQCLECGQTFAQGNALKCHKRVHTGEKPYKCKFCNKCFTQNTILKTHMTLHTGKTVKCPDCDKKFSRASYLILHRREHTGEKPYTCELCPNRYKQKSHLDRHMDTHMGVRHKCEICQKEYSKQWSLKMHMFTHSESKPYKCDECGVSFVRRDKYKMHMKSIHSQIVTDSKVGVTILPDV